MGSLPENHESPMIGRRIGVYELTEELGRGGMGIVYLAKRVDGEFRQTVAVKLIKRGMDTDLILKSFRRERQITATLDHPNIAYFLGGGSTEDGLPYFVMEYIKGKPLYQFCNENKLDIKERLQIFQQICEAIEYAHQKNIVHRDLKPSNILVKPDKTPKLLDFGIAKVLDCNLNETEIDITATAMRVMTPEYASPEQISGELINNSSDIYSLGVILYELLTGHRPYRLKRQVPHEVARIILEEIPLPPSVKNSDAELEIRDLSFISQEGNLLTEVQKTQTSISNTNIKDLDKIVLKALNKDPTKRYISAAEFAEDITNYLENRPVKAKSIFVEPVINKIAKKKSVAILPFKIIGAENSQNTEDIFLGIGLADALVSRLSGVRRLIVRPTSSVLPFAEENPIEAGKKIGVNFILDGTIRRVGDRIRVSVQLLSVGENSARWAEKFDEKFTDVLELEDSISEKVAKVLLPQLTGRERRRLEKRGTNNTQAYQAYLRGRYFANQFTDEALLKSIQCYNEAIELDPDYALPHLGIADFYIWSSVFGEIPSQDAYPKAKEFIQTALNIDDSLGEAYALLAFVTLLFDWNWSEAERLVKRALELNPNNHFAHECYSNFFSTQGVFDEAFEEIRHAEELDPLSPRAKLMTSWTFYQGRKFSQAVAKSEQANEMVANFPQGLTHLGNSLAHIGKTNKPVETLSSVIFLWKNSAMAKYMLCYAFAANGQMEEARQIVNELLESAENGHVKPYFIAMAFAAIGENNEAFKWFEKAIAERNEWMVWFGTDPKLDALRKDVRYRIFLQQTNNPIIEKFYSIHKESITGSTQKSIAVLPFRFLNTGQTGESGDEFLSLGLADALTMRLSNMRRFLVRPTSSIILFGQTNNTDPFEAGRELGVDFIVEGNIRRVGKMIRVTAQLLDVCENSTFWAEHFDEISTDVLALEDSISERVTKCLLPKLTGEERRQLGKRGTEDPQAFEAYMRGRYFWNHFTPDAFPKALECFEKAVELDPNYALAYVGIADFWTWSTIYGLFQPTESYPKILSAISRALEIDETLGEAHATLALYNANHWNWAEAEKNYFRSIELSPNYPHTHEWYATLLVSKGWFEEGMKEIRLAEKLDPLSLRTKTLTAWTAYQSRNFEECLAKSRELIEFDPQYAQGYMQLGNVLLELGEIDEALEASGKAFEMFSESPMPVYIYCFALKAAGRIEEARKISSELEHKASQAYIPPYFLAMCQFAIGNVDIGFKYLEQSFEEQNAWCFWIETEPKLDSIRTDKRFLKLQKMMGIEKQ